MSPEWHETDLPPWVWDVRCRTTNGPDVDAAPGLSLTHMYGPAVRCKPNVNKWRGLVLRICIRPLHGAFMLLAIMDIRAHPISFSERPREAAWVTRSRVRRRDRFSISSIQL